MPVVLRVKGFRFWFYEANLDEPPHVHIGKGGSEAKYWIDPIRLARAGRFRSAHAHEIERILAGNRRSLLGFWQQELDKRGHS